MIIEDEKSLVPLVEELKKQINIGDVIALIGVLGAGKTSLVRSFMRVFANDPALEVPSPSFTLIQEYMFDNLKFYHFDLYRLSEIDELIELGIPEIFDGAISFIEWPERLGIFKPPNLKSINIIDLGGERREILLSGFENEKA